MAMPRTKASEWTVADYDQAAAEYCRRLPLEHFMEAPPQATQRKVAWDSLEELCRRCGDLQVYNELLIQYFRGGRLRRVVPDNMLCRSQQPLASDSSYNMELEKAVPLLVLEYVSPNNMRKDCNESFRKHERELKVPYCLIYSPEKQDLQLFHLEKRRYQRVPANARGRYEIADLEVEVAVLDGWVRFWHRGELLPLPNEMQEQLAQEKQRAERAEAELAKLREQLAQLQGRSGQQT